MKVRISKLSSSATIPTKGHKFDAGWDLYADRVEFNKPYNGQCLVHTGIAIEVPVGYVGLIFPRSSVIKTSFQLGNSVGVIDPGYVGEIKMVFDNVRVGNTLYEVGDRCGQFVLIKNTLFDWEEVESLSDTDRGVSGFGSTGK